MKTYQCTGCGHQLQRPTQPLKCPQCGRQAIGLFRAVAGAAQQPGTAAPTAGAAIPQAGSAMRPAAPAQHGGVSPIGAPPPPPGSPAPPAASTPPPPAVAHPQPAPVYAPQTPAVQPGPAQPVPPRAESPAPQVQTPPLAQTPAPKQRSAPPPLPSAAKPQAATRPARPTPPPVEKQRPASLTRSPSAPVAAPPKREPPKPKPKVRPTPLRPKEFVWAWPPEPPFEDDARAMRNAPAVDPQGRVVLCCQGRLVALVEDEGKAKVVWEYVIGSPVPGPISVAADGTIRAHCADGYLHCLNAAGRQEWSPVRVGEPLGFAAPVVDEQGNTYVSAFRGGLLRVDAEGRLQPRAYFRSRRKLDSAGTIHEGVLYIGSDDGYVFAVRLGEGRGECLWDHAAEQGRTGWYVNCSPAIAADGTVVVAARDEHLYGFHPDGRTAWATRMPGQMLGSPVIDRHGHLYVGVFQTFRGQGGKGFLVSLDGNSHKIRWRYDAAGEVESTPVIGDDDLVYVGDDSGTLHAVDFDGHARWTAKVEAAVRSAGTIIAPQRLAFGLDDDTLVVLRCTAQGLAREGWPKFGRTLGQCGVA